MQYMLLIYSDEDTWQTLSDDERGRWMQDYGDYTEELRSAGAMVDGSVEVRPVLQVPAEARP